jgi:hypothetical protein
MNTVSPDIFHPVPREGAIERDWRQRIIICEILNNDWSGNDPQIIAHFEFAPGDTSKVKGRKPTGNYKMMFALPIVAPYVMPSAD